MKKKTNRSLLIRFLTKLGRYVELFLAILIIVVIVLSALQLIYELTHIHIFDMHSEFFMDFLGRTLSLAVGIEFIKMLCEHNADNIVDVLLTAIVRQMVVEHLDSLQTLIGVAAVAILYATKKFLIKSKKNKKTKLSEVQSVLHEEEPLETIHGELEITDPEDNSENEEDDPEELSPPLHTEESEEIIQIKRIKKPKSKRKKL